MTGRALTSAVPAPPNPIDPLIETWPAGQPIFRCHDRKYAASGFNPGPRPATRFAFFGEPPVGVLYGGGSEEVAVAETILHDLPTRGGEVQRPLYVNRVLSTVRPDRDLHLASFRGGGLIRLEIEAHELTDTDPTTYEQTVHWAAAVHRDLPAVDGIIWTSRRWNSDPAITLFADRTPERLLAIDATHRVFAAPRDFEWLAALCRTLNVEIEPPV